MRTAETPSKRRLDPTNTPGAQRSHPAARQDRVYVQFTSDTKLPDSDPNLRYTDESDAYDVLSTRGHFTANPNIPVHPSPLVNGDLTTPSRSRDQTTSRQPNANYQYEPMVSFERPTSERPLEARAHRDRADVYQEQNMPTSARSYELSPSNTRQPQSSPRQSQGVLADKIGSPTKDNFDGGRQRKVKRFLFIKLRYLYFWPS